MIAAVAALVWANSPFGDSYGELWSTELSIGLGGAEISDSLKHWVDDGLMVLFFFVVGLEVKREVVVGELNEFRTAAVPAIAALGGMIVPAGIYIALNAGTEGTSGWGIPMATDIAFALGVLALLGKRAPSALKVFLLSLAIVDDIGAILVIAVFYSESLNLTLLAVAGGLLGLMVIMRYVGIRYVPVYALVGIGVWLATLESGVHATIAGIAIAMITPARPLTDRAEQVEGAGDLGGPHETQVQIHQLRETVAPAERLVHLLHPWTSYVVLPVFALANAGLVLSLEDLGGAVTSRVALGVALGLVVGKIVGISAATFLAQKTGLGRLPEGVTTRQVVAVSAVAGIGFTVSLFITSLAFTDDALIADAKVGILAASILTAAVAYVILRLGPAPEEREQEG